MGANVVNRPALRRVYPSSDRASIGIGAFQQHRITLTEPDMVWRDEVIQRLEELVRLDVGWDGYHGVPVTFENATFALRMLEATCRDNVTAPQIVPGSSGELQIEWHTETGDIELLVKGPNSVHAWRCSAEDEEEVDLTNNFLVISHWVNELMEPSIALRAAA